VKVITLDELIETHGIPAFVKIDVEGYEAEVFAGLSRAIQVVCFEANLPAYEEETVLCIEKYARLVQAEFNYTTDEPPTVFASNSWLSAGAMCALIRTKQISYAEIYGRAV